MTRRALAGAAICAAVGATAGCGDEVLPPDEQARQSIAAVRGVSQDGPILGAGTSPTLMVFARVDDLRLADFVTDALPQLVRERVRRGRMRVRLQTLTTGPGADDDGVRLAWLAQTAGLQDRLWEVLGSVAARYPGVFDDEFVRAVRRDVPKLSRSAFTRGGSARRIEAAIDRANGLAHRLDLPGFAYVIERRDRSLEVLRPQTAAGLLRDLADPKSRVSHRMPAPTTEAAAEERPGRTAHPFRGELAPGATGEAVEELQRGLQVKVTGAYDEATRDAVQAFQRSRNLDADGVTGEQTWTAIFAPATR